MTTGTISSLKRPDSIAATARFCDSKARASCSSRLMPYSSATFSAVIPIWYSLKASDKPSLIMVSTTFESPIRPPQRKLGKTYGA